VADRATASGAHGGHPLLSAVLEPLAGYGESCLRQQWVPPRCPDALPHDMDLPACVHGGENASDAGRGCLRLLRILTPHSLQKNHSRALRFRGPDSRGCSELLAKLMQSESVAFFPRTQARILGNAHGSPWACWRRRVVGSVAGEPDDRVVDNETAGRATATRFEGIPRVLCPVRQPLLEHAPPAPPDQGPYAACSPSPFQAPQRPDVIVPAADSGPVRGSLRRDEKVAMVATGKTRRDARWLGDQDSGGPQGDACDPRTATAALAACRASLFPGAGMRSTAGS